MKGISFNRVVMLVAVAVGGVWASSAAGEVAPVVESRAEPFHLSRVRLTGGPLARQQELNRRYLQKLDPDRLLCFFRIESGLDPKAPPYRGWESDGGLKLYGHILGFYLSGAATTYSSTGDETLRRNLEYIVDELAAIQAHNGNGFALACPDAKKVFAGIVSGELKARPNKNDPRYCSFIGKYFEPIYTMNKVLIGLLETYRATGYEKARTVFLAMSDWFGEAIVDKMDDKRLQELIFCEHGSLPETFADAYLMTGEEKYRNWAKRLCHRLVLEPLAKGDGAFFTGLHANDTIPKYTGFERVYRVTGDAEMHRAAVNAWEEIVTHRCWANGGNSTDEHFFDPADFLKALNGVGPESCNSVNMLRQTEALFQTEPDERRMDFYERVLFNHLLATHDDTGMTCYYTPMQPNRYRVFSDPFDAMWCCTGTGLESPGKFGRMVYTHDAVHGAVAVHLFAPSTLDWRERKVKLEQRTGFPYEQGTTLVITEAPAAGVEFTLGVRHPAWVADGAMTLTLNGRQIGGESRSGTLASVSRVWKTGDVLKVSLPMKLRVENLPGTTPGTEAYAAYMYGPVLLAGELGRQGLTKRQFWSYRSARGDVKPAEDAPRPIAEDNAALAEMLEPVPDEPLHFRSRGFWPREVRLAPMFEVVYERYAVYWQRMTAAELAERRAEAAERERLDAATVDRVVPNDKESEKGHELKGEHTESGTGMYGRRHDTAWRHAGRGGWFSYRLRCEGARTLYFSHYGREPRRRRFDVEVDGRLLSTCELKDEGVDGLVAVKIALPDEFVRGKQHVTVTFRANHGAVAGGIFDVRTLR